MRGHTHRRRIKFYRDQYRILYDVFERQKAIYIFRVRPRKDVYRGQ